MSRTLPALTHADATNLAAQRITLSGHVQGVGARPAVQRLAERLQLTGVVRNTVQGVEISVEGVAERVERFKTLLRQSLPAEAQVLDMQSRPLAAVGFKAFVIERGACDDAITATIPSDAATCDACHRETTDERDRRFGYPLTSCAACGPRYTIVRQMPFERADTAMNDFPLCESCRAEYGSIDDRRFHAQTIACRRCGPNVWCVDERGHAVGEADAAVAVAARAIAEGKIVAVKGLGGYQLLVDATSPRAVERLRRRKGRPSKPLAVMVESLEQAERLAAVDDDERQALLAAGNSIVVVAARSPSPLASAVHPGLNVVGLLSPTTAMHHMLLRMVGRPVICTSGNREGEPLEFDADDAESRLADVCDFFLHHNRPIVRPIDDSVVRVVAGRPTSLRLARGLAPLRLDLPSSKPVLAVGGQMKVAAAWCNGAASFLGPHVGGLESLPMRDRYCRQISDWQALYRFEPESIVHDAHPDYFTSRWAESHAARRLAVQHHHAHVVAAMLEHGWLDRAVLGVAWDGTGYGSDGTVWGGEFLIASAHRFERFAHLRCFSLPGGETAVREPWRTAAALLHEAGMTEQIATILGPQVGDKTKTLRLISILDHRHWSPLTSSAGRLFDGAASLILNVARSGYEGQAAMMLESAADRSEAEQYSVALVGAAPLQLDWRPMIAEIVEDKRTGVYPERMAMKFHRGLAAGIIDVCRKRPDLPVVLAGGVFQNRLLVELIVEASADSSQPFGLPGRIPPGDGGLAAGQLAIALLNEHGS